MLLKLDTKDKRILHLLELDSRQSYSNIAKKIGLSREVVSYRIKRFEDTGLIDKYVLILNPKMIGYESFKWYIQLENADNDKLQEIIGSMQDHPYCVWITTCTGRWDLTVVFFVVSSLHFRRITEDFLHKFSKYIRETTFTIELDIYHFKKKYLWEEEMKLYKTPYMGGDPEQVKLDLEEIKVLTHLCENPRYSIVDISRKSNLTVDVVRHRLQKMEKNGLIQGARVNINHTKLGFASHKILFNTRKNNPERENEFVNYLKNYKNVWDVIHCLGNWNMEVNIDVKDSVEFHNMIMDLKNKFPDIIQNYNSIQLFENHKYNFFPMGSELISDIEMAEKK